MKLWLLSLLLFAAISLHADDRIALVIGNNAYPELRESQQLTSPRADATDVAKQLRDIGFTVLEPVLDGTRETIIAAKARFLEQAKDAQIALFYFSGHGFQVGEENFLIPSDMPRITSYTVLKDNALLLRDSLMVGLEEAGAQTKVIVLDCCRDNPFAAQLEKALSGTNKSLRTKGGTGEISGYGAGFYLAFATSPGTSADDGNGQRNSPFTSALLTHLKDKAGENIRDLFDEVKETVRETSGEEQVPWTNDSLSKSHVKILAKTATTPQTAAGRTPLLATKDAPFVNALGMKFVPVVTYKNGKKVLFSIWETRRQDYATYAAKNSGVDDSWKAQEYKGVPIGQKDDEPVVSVNWWDATAFCEWLTETERAAGRIGANDEYRLPTDVEWSYAVGIGEQEDASATPEAKDGKLADVYPWGKGFPPPAGSGNYSDATAKAKVGFTGIDGYNDGYATTSPVGSYEPNSKGLYDLGGNVWEWCGDWYNAEQKYRVLRGASWDDDVASSALSSYRDYCDATYRNGNFGFRCVLVAGVR